MYRFGYKLLQQFARYVEATNCFVCTSRVKICGLCNKILSPQQVAPIQSDLILGDLFPLPPSPHGMSCWRAVLRQDSESSVCLLLGGHLQEEKKRNGEFYRLVF